MSTGHDLIIAAAGAVLFHGVLFTSLSDSWTPEYEYIVSPTSLEISLVDTEIEKKDKRIILDKNDTKSEKLPQPAYEKDVKKETEDKSKPHSIKREKNLNQGALAPARPLSHLNQPPSYPHLARVRGYEGTVILKVQVSSNGNVENARMIMSSGFDVLDEAAKEAIQKWHFEPARVLGISRSSALEIPVIFKLKN